MLLHQTARGFRGARGGLPAHLSTRQQQSLRRLGNKRFTTWKEEPLPALNKWISLSARGWVNLSERRRGLFILDPAANFQLPVEVFQLLRAVKTGNQGFLRAHWMSDPVISHETSGNFDAQRARNSTSPVALAGAWRWRIMARVIDLADLFAVGFESFSDCPKRLAFLVSQAKDQVFELYRRRTAVCSATDADFRLC